MAQPEGREPARAGELRHGILGVVDALAQSVALLSLALGVAFAVSYRWPAWRIGVVGYALFQYSFHAVNHLVDIGDADPERMGPIDFAALALTAPVFGWMLVQLARERRGPAP